MDSRIENGMKAQFVERAAALAAGAAQIGWKSAFGSPAAMEKMGISTPLVGFMTDKRRLEAGAAIDVSGWAKPVIEMEMAVDNQKPFKVKTIHNFNGHFVGGIVFQRALDALVLAVQQFLNDVIRSRQVQAAAR